MRPFYTPKIESVETLQQWIMQESQFYSITHETVIALHMKRSKETGALSTTVDHNKSEAPPFVALRTVHVILKNGNRQIWVNTLLDDARIPQFRCCRSISPTGRIPYRESVSERTQWKSWGFWNNACRSWGGECWWTVYQENQCSNNRPSSELQETCALSIGEKNRTSGNISKELHFQNRVPLIRLLIFWLV